MLRDKQVLAGGSNDILAYLQRKHGATAAARGSLLVEPSADITAFAAMVQGDLKDVQLYAEWLFPGAYVSTKRSVARRTIFPLSMFVPSYMRRDHERYLVARRLTTPRQMRVVAARCYAALAGKIRASGGPFLFGGIPSMADGMLYQHLLFATRSEALISLLLPHDTLLKLYETMRLRCFPEDPVFVPPPPRTAREATTDTSSSSKGTKTRVIIVGAVVLYILAVRFL